MISESQERMVAVVPARAARARSRRSRALGAAPRRDRRGDGHRRAARVLRRRRGRRDPGRAPHRRVPALRGRAGSPSSGRSGACAVGSARTSSRKRWIYEQYDHLVRSRTVRRPGLDAAVLRLRPSWRGLAVSLDGPPLGERDPRAAGAQAVLEAARNVACAGGEPLALTDCLNFGNPEKPEIGWELGRGDRGHRRGGGGARDPRRLRQRVALQRDRRAGDPADAGRRLRRARRGRARGPAGLARRATASGSPRATTSRLIGVALAQRVAASRSPTTSATAALRIALVGGIGVQRPPDVRGARRGAVRLGESLRRRRTRTGLGAAAMPSASSGTVALMCGVFGIRAPDRDVARVTYFGLFALQHRGQESAGIAVSDEGRLTVLRDMGLVTQVFDEQKLRGLRGDTAIGHTRYSTTGSTQWTNAQPLIQRGRGRTVALGHNGNLVNASELREELAAEGIRLSTTSDTELIAALIANDPAPARGRGRQRDGEARGRLLGGRALGREADRLPRPAFGFRPLCLGREDDHWLLASETCALDNVGAELEREVSPGELIVIDEEGPHARQAVDIAGARSALHLRVLLPRPPGLAAEGSRGARRARPDGRAARGRSPRRGRPRAADPRLGHAGRDRVLARERDPVLGGPDQEPLRRPHVHPARPGPPRAGRQAEVQPARRGRGQARGRRRRLDRAREHDAQDRRRCSSRPERRRCTSASRRRP